MTPLARTCTRAHTHTHGQKRTHTHGRLHAVRPLIGLPGSVWIPTGCRAAAVVLSISLCKVRTDQRRGESELEWVSACWIKNLVSSCVDPRADNQLPACEAGDTHRPHPPNHSPQPRTPLSCCQGPSGLKAKLDNVVSCWSSPRSLRPWNARHPNNRCHLYPRRVGAPPPPIQTAFHSPCPSVTAHFPPFRERCQVELGSLPRHTVPGCVLAYFKSGSSWR